ncbi:hypothetical protein [Rhodococcus koreensis]|uniref:hypothetical protein n=1 Tax=Rhodococcus koreensis TaxID=99653 RepID=UPI00197E0956|nr:hypothetical protein [Rhodococcus koreensis]QSE86371.1 hypothetical protein JWS14_46090 [Rhodococcus koreensis]
MSSSSVNRCAVIERSTMFSSDCPVCSSIIEAILIAFPVDGGGELEIHSPHRMRGVGFDLRARS